MAPVGFGGMQIVLGFSLNLNTRWNCLTGKEDYKIIGIMRCWGKVNDLVIHPTNSFFILRGAPRGGGKRSPKGDAYAWKIALYQI